MISMAHIFMKRTQSSGGSSSSLLDEYLTPAYPFLLQFNIICMGHIFISLGKMMPFCFFKGTASRPAAKERTKIGFFHNLYKMKKQMITSMHNSSYLQHI
jgi:hypothetical protein